MYLLKVELNGRECKIAPPPLPLPIQTRVTFREFEELIFPNWSTSKVQKKKWKLKGPISLTAINLSYLVNYDKQLYIFFIFLYLLLIYDTIRVMS